MDDRHSERRVWIQICLRLLVVFGVVLCFALMGVAALALTQPGGFIVIGLSILLGMPFLLSALAAFLMSPNGDGYGGHYLWAPPILVGITLFAGGILINEGVICIVMLFPLWVPMSIWGSLTVRGWHRKLSAGRRAVSTFDASLIFVIPIFFAWVDAYIPQQTSEYEVRRSVVLDATPADVWPLFLELDDIRKAEGRWNVAQNVLQIPRPSSAIVAGEGAGAIRQAKWGADIRFEEHIFDWQDQQAMRWKFAFPDDSISRYTDRHIEPDGQHLKIDEGGYRLEALSDGRTRVTLYTRYQATTPVNLYAAAWGELILGDIQSNVLSILKSRASENLYEN